MRFLQDLAHAAEVIRRGVLLSQGRRRWAKYERGRERLPVGHFQAVVYFADDLVNLYQLEQWYEPLRQLSLTHPVAVVTRRAVTAAHIADHCPLPVVHLPRVGDLETWIAHEPVAVVFYLNQDMHNFQMLRFRHPAHVFLSHGESEKDYMASNQIKAYDYAFVAGDAARDRLRDKLIGYDVEVRTITIGRPQVDVHVPTPVALPDDERTVVLYAPTWEGDRPSMTYSSLLTHATAMVTALIAAGTYRIIYRPHPRTGVSDRQYRRAHEAVVALLRADVVAGHVIDQDSAFGWHLDAADACIADVSAVAFDWLATGKPMVLTVPTNPAAAVASDGMMSAVPTVSHEDAPNICNALAQGDDSDGRARRAAFVMRHFGDVSAGASMRRWLYAAEYVMNQRAMRADPASTRE